MLLLENQRFDLLQWRMIVQKAGVDVFGEDCQTITPFGFEVTKDRTYLQKNLNRFYCYINLNNDASPTIENEKRFISALLKRIYENDPVFFDRISIVVYENDNRSVELLKKIEQNSILLNVEQRSTTDLLIDYAQYLACCLKAIVTNTLPEFKRFSGNLNVCNRCYQLYLIIEYATQYLSIPFSKEESDVFSSVHSLKKSPLDKYHTSTITHNVTKQDEYNYSIILERLRKIYKHAFSEVDNSIHMIKKAYNSNIVFEQDIPFPYYCKFTDYIKSTYLEYGRR